METETTWIDAWIRWDRNSKEIVDDDGDDNDDDCEEEERVPPSTEFSFHYKLPSNEVDAADSTSTTLTLTLKGFPSESEQIWNSTGLTLWPSSHYLCEYLLDHYRELLLLDPAKRSTTNSNSTGTTTSSSTTILLEVLSTTIQETTSSMITTRKQKQHHREKFGPSNWVPDWDDVDSFCTTY